MGTLCRSSTAVRSRTGTTVRLSSREASVRSGTDGIFYSDRGTHKAVAVPVWRQYPNSVQQQLQTFCCSTVCL